jgi:hypothetical protein
MVSKKDRKERRNRGGVMGRKWRNRGINRDWQEDE